MDSNSSRETILSKIAAASKGRSVFVGTDEYVPKADIYKPVLPDLLTCFKNELEIISGKVVVCADEAELYSLLKDYLQQNKINSVFCRDSYIAAQLKGNKIPTTADDTDFISMQAGITGCEFLVARTGSVVVSSANESGRQMNVFPPVHIVLAHVSQLVELPEDALVAVKEKYDDAMPSVVTTITGPSRTADIEKTLVLGAHGPKEFVVFISKV